MHFEDIKRAKKMGWKPAKEGTPKHETQLQELELEKQYEMQSRMADQEQEYNGGY